MLFKFSARKLISPNYLHLSFPILLYNRRFLKILLPITSSKVTIALSLLNLWLILLIIPEFKLSTCRSDLVLRLIMSTSTLTDVLIYLFLFLLYSYKLFDAVFLIWFYLLLVNLLLEFLIKSKLVWLTLMSDFKPVILSCKLQSNSFIVFNCLLVVLSNLFSATWCVKPFELLSIKKPIHKSVFFKMLLNVLFHLTILIIFSLMYNYVLLFIYFNVQSRPFGVSSHCRLWLEWPHQTKKKE